MNRSLALVLVAAAIAVGACGDAGGDVAPPPPPPVPASTAPLPPRPAVPDGPLPPGVEANLDAVFSQAQFLTAGSVADLASSGDLRVAWPLADLLRFHEGQETGPGLELALEALTGFDPGDDAAQWVAYTDLLLRWDVPAPPGYLRWKRQAFVSLDPTWAPFFDDEADLDWREVAWGGVLRDRIEALVDPPDVDGAAAAGGDWLPDDDVVFGVAVGGEARAYPRRVMEVHELVNDTVGGRRIGLPYCTLCGSAVGYVLDDLPAGVATPELRTSGLLQRSNKLMYDARSESLFDQFSGVALSGPLRDAGVVLPRLLGVVTTTWGEWKEAHPRTTVLTADAGTGRTYGEDPLGDRDENGPIFPVGERDGRRPAQEPVFGVTTPQGVSVAFPVARAEAELEAGRPVAAGGVELRREAGGLAARATGGGPDLPGQQAFWFAWSQFRPGTLLWAPPEGG